MIKKIEMTMDFEKAKPKIRKLVKELPTKVFADKDFASSIKKRIIDSKTYRGDTIKNLEKSTLNIRKMRGRGGNKPLVDTGKLLKSIKNVKKKNKVGVSMMKYGMHQAKGFTTKNHFAVKKNNKVVGFRDYSAGISVPPRPFVYPLEGEIKKTQSSDVVFAGLTNINKKDAINAVKLIKKALRGKFVHKFK